ncbi:hypothetical protein AXF42_Ash016656 [Apostasia shenzhenica]|uniref:Uncharacterized protein n=1 Tax=Apostasia shenzhenica TaxID=1088818 RepID=A0A2I0A1R0_9ASPA|nr:hypothetical protein AXF42_Ash016656 [Apostasia shenzhenica]
MTMVFSSGGGFLAGNPLLSLPTNDVSKLPRPSLLRPWRSCSASMKKEASDDVNHKSNGDRWPKTKLAIVALAAGVLALGASGDAVAAKSGGRVGGQAFRSTAPRSSGPRVNNSRTNIYINPPVAPPLVGGYGYGLPFYGGWGWSPFTFFTSGPAVAVGVGGGFEVLAAVLVFGAVAAVVRRLLGRRVEDEEDY